VAPCSAGLNVNFRDIATGNTALYHVSERTPMEQEKPDTFAALKTKTAQFLTERGADPRVCNNDGTDCISVAVCNASNVSLVRHLLSVLPDKSFLASHTNDYGNSCMHYALHHTFNKPVHEQQLQLLLDSGVSVNAPKNTLGQTPLQVWAGYTAKSAAKCAILMGVQLQDVIPLIQQPERKKGPSKGQWHRHHGNGLDLCKGRVAWRMCGISEPCGGFLLIGFACVCVCACSVGP